MRLPWLTFDSQTGTFSGTPQDENVGFIKVKVTAKDYAKESVQNTFTLRVANVNKLPTIKPNQTFNIDENSKKFTSVGKVIATDADNDFLLDWKIVNGNLDVDGDGKTAFSIHYITGEIKVNDDDDLDFETNPNFQLQVTASDRTDNSIPTTVTVNLNDIAGQQIIGTSSNDRKLYGGLESDTIDGKERNDYLYGLGGNDTLIGGTGNDNLYGGEGDDSIDGGKGFDIIRESADVNFTLTETQLVGNGIDSFVNIERAILSGGNSDNIIDASQYNKSTHLYGRGGNDTLKGGIRSDYLYGEQGDDSIDGGKGYDTLRETKDVDFILTNTQLTGNGKDTLANIERVILTGGNSDNKIDASGFNGSTYLYGRGGNDTLKGGTGR
ncbi:MAG: putative Ig domain-containing protein, partial [Rivularia sp. ALOHA_DT_140]|nr:putative Ig domain-containing protein [Rivularia sp. ALOHA_DT_140]